MQFFNFNLIIDPFSTLIFIAASLPQACKWGSDTPWIWTITGRWRREASHSAGQKQPDGFLGGSTPRPSTAPGASLFTEKGEELLAVITHERRRSERRGKSWEIKKGVLQESPSILRMRDWWPVLMTSRPMGALASRGTNSLVTRKRDEGHEIVASYRTIQD